MSELISSSSRRGLRDWMIQRFSAILLLFYMLGIFFYFTAHPQLSYGEWHYLFSHHWMKIATLIFVLSLLFHAWVGVWTIFTDYVKPFVLRAILNSAVLLILVACFFWAILILWSV